MRILLVNPPAGRRTLGLKHLARVEPLGLEVVGAAVRDHEVRLLDLELHRDAARLRRALDDFRPEIVGVGAQIVQTYTALEVVRRAKQRDPDVTTVVGGHHATLRPDDFAALEVDAIVLGEGSARFRELLARVAGDGNLEDVDGLALPRDGELAYTEPRAVPSDLSEQPLPDRSLTASDRDEYYYLHYSPVALVQTAMGCSFPCSFCTCQKFSNRRYVARSPEGVVEDLERVDADFVMFADDHSFLDPERMDRLAELIDRRGIEKRYFAYSRVDTVADNPELFRRWADVGLELLMTGLEALDDDRLDSFEKKVESRTHERALDVLENCGVGVSAGFVVTPDFTEEDFRRIDDYIRDHPKIVLAELTPLTPLPGTDLYAERKGDLLTRNREVFDLAHFVLPTATPTLRMYRLMARHYQSILWTVVRRLGLYRPANWLQRHTRGRTSAR